MNFFLMAFCFNMVFISDAFAFIVGKVNIQEVLMSVNQGKKVREQLEKEFNLKKEEIRKEEDKLRLEQEGLQKKSSVVTPDALRKEEEQLQKKIFTLQQKVLEYQKNIKDMEKKLLTPIQNNLLPIVKEISQKNKISVTFQSPQDGIMFAEKEIDITKEVIASYNSKHK